MDLLERLNNYITEEGVKCSYIATRLGINRATISHWKKGRRNLSTTLQLKLDNFLKSKGY